MRRCEVLAPDQTWRPTPIEALAPGDVFRLFDEAGEPVQDAEGCGRWRCVRAPERREDGEYGVVTEPVPDSEVEEAAKREGFWWPGEGHGNDRLGVSSRGSGG